VVAALRITKERSFDVDTNQARLYLIGGVLVGAALLLLKQSPKRLRRDSESFVNRIPRLSPERRKREIEIQYRLRRYVPFYFLVLGLMAILSTLL